MPIIAVDLDGKLYGQVRAAVATGSYGSLQEFMEVAAWNQLALQGIAGGEVAGRTTQKNAPPREGVSARLVGRDPVSADGQWRSNLRAVDASSLADLVEPKVIPGRDQVLWGQTNRVLPMAAGVRVLANLLSETKGVVTRRDWYEEATSTARQLRVWLGELDRLAARKRGELWATAFPEFDESSGHRFTSQFLGAPGKEGGVSGGAAFLGFVSFDGPNDLDPVRLTTSGAEWVGFRNPVFDGEDPVSTFSPEEASFLLDHLRELRSGEYEFLSTVARLVGDARSRTEIDAELAHLYPMWATYIGTMRAGAIGRLSDLGLLHRTRRGLEVDYHLSDLAMKLKIGSSHTGAA